MNNFGEYVIDDMTGVPKIFRNRYHAITYRDHRLKKTSKEIISIKVRLMEANKDGSAIIPNNEEIIYRFEAKVGECHYTKKKKVKEINWKRLRKMVLNNQYIEAIKEVRNNLDLSLYHAKKLVDRQCKKTPKNDYKKKKRSGKGVRDIMNFKGDITEA